MILVSACLAGFRCRYDGKSNLDERVVHLVRKGKAIPVCPEQLGGLYTPRPCCEIRSDTRRVFNCHGEDLTDNFERGAREAARLAKLFGTSYALLQERSPSCGVNIVYDGTFSGRLITGKGITAELLQEKGVILFTLDQFDELLVHLNRK